jgi:hypothetical protein
MPHSPAPVSFLVVEEYFAAADERFIEALRSAHQPKQLAAFVTRWQQDPRPWAREQMLRYLLLPLDSQGHQVVIKRLFKWAEKQQDTALLAHFAVAFDSLVRRVKKTRHRYDWQSRTSFQEEILHTPRNSFPKAEPPKQVTNPFTGRQSHYTAPSPKNARLFKYRTRYYLRRRVWRFFRRLKFQQPQFYITAVTEMLRLYRDADLSLGQDLLECWSLLHALYRHHPALEFGATNVRVAEGAKLADLAPAPAYLELWQAPAAANSLLMLVAQAKARLIRSCAIDLLRKHHTPQLPAFPLEQVLSLLEDPDTAVQQFACECLKLSGSLSSLPLQTWLELINIDQPELQAQLTEIFREQVPVEQLALADCVELACAVAVPVARLGWNYLRQRHIEPARDKPELTRLTKLRCGSLGHEVTTWLLEHYARGDQYDREVLSLCCDSLVPEVRVAAWDFLVQSEPARDDALLYARLVESPHDDLRLRLIDELQRKSELPGLSGQTLTPLWATVLLGVQRGNRQKPKAAAQLAAAIVEQPTKAAALLPVLLVAVRSLRGPEMRAGLAAVMQTLERCPELQPIVAEQLPELVLESTTTRAVL